MTNRWRFVLFPLRWTQWLGPFLLAGAAGLLVAVLVITSGIVNLAASTPHPQGWAALLHYVFKRSTAHHSAALVPPADLGTPAQIAKGAVYYGMVCAHCHGGPNLGQNPIALSMRPRPQYLFKEIGGFTAPELFWIVKHGVKYSAMPSFPVQDRDDEVWSIVSFLQAMPKMSTARYRELAYGDTLTAPAVANVGALGATFASRPYTLPHANAYPRESSYMHPAIGFDSFSITGDVVKTCERCHTGQGVGADGGAIPNITLLNAGYFKTALTRFANGVRHSGYMQPVATQLDTAQMEQLAQYYTTQPRRRSDSAAGTADELALGQRIAVDGIPARGIGPCAGCHDVTRAASKAFPAIDGQHRLYLAGRLRQFRTQPPTIGGGNPMVAIAHKLKDRDIDAVAAFYAQRAPGALSPIVALREDGAQAAK